MFVSKATVLGLILGLLSSTALGADPRREAINKLIEGQEFEKAGALVDVELAKKPAWVDGWMFKGNLAIYTGCAILVGNYVGANPDESIYESGIGIIGEMPDPERCSEATAKKASAYFQQALDLDPSREDIQLGACWILSKAGLVDLLVPRLKILRDRFNKDNRAFDMMDYARNVVKSSGFDAGNKVYEAIVALFPDLGDLHGDFASTALSNQRPQEALRLARLALASSKHDVQTSGNVVLTATVLGDYRLGMEAATEVKLKGRESLSRLYGGLLAQKNGDPAWRKSLEKYNLENPVDAKDGAFVHKWLSVNEKDPSAYVPILADIKNTSLYLLASEYLWNRDPNLFAIGLDLADTYGGFKVYGRDLEILAKLLSSPHLSPERKFSCLLRKGWALQETGKSPEAAIVWTELLQSKDIYEESAACWFLGQACERKKDPAGALGFYKRVSSKANKSKYANYCNNAKARLEAKPE